MKKEIKATIDEIAEDSFQYMSTDYGKDGILNPGVVIEPSLKFHGPEHSLVTELRKSRTIC